MNTNTITRPGTPRLLVDSETPVLRRQARRLSYAPIASQTARPTSSVVAGLARGRRSAVTQPEATTSSIAFAIAAASRAGRNCSRASPPPIRWRRAGSRCPGRRCRAPTRAPARTGRPRRPRAGGRRSTPRQHADGARQHRALVAQDVAEHVLGQHDVEAARVEDQLHRAVVHQEVVERHVGVSGRDFDDHAAPELRVLEHVRLVHARHVACAGRRASWNAMRATRSISARV